MLFRLLLVVSKLVVVLLGLVVFWLWSGMVAAQEVSDGLVADTSSEGEEVLKGVSDPGGGEDVLLDMFAE